MKLSSSDKKDLAFVWAIILIPLIHFFIFYIYVNFNSILMAFQRYTVRDGFFWTGTENFKSVIYDLKNMTQMQFAVRNSFLVYIISFIVSKMISLLFSFYIFKNKKFGKVFKVIIFLPSIISAIVFVSLFVNIADRAIPQIASALFGVENMFGLLVNSQTEFATILFYNIWIGLGSGVILYVGAMSGIDEALIEAASIDGATKFREFIHIVFPMIWPTWSVLVYTGIVGFFLNDMNMFSFKGSAAAPQLYTLGYFIYIKTIALSGNIDYNTYTYISALGILLTAVAVPATYLVKWALEKFGPSVD